MLQVHRLEKYELESESTCLLLLQALHVALRCVALHIYGCIRLWLYAYRDASYRRGPIVVLPLVAL